MTYVWILTAPVVGPDSVQDPVLLQAPVLASRRWTGSPRDWSRTPEDCIHVEFIFKLDTNAPRAATTTGRHFSTRTTNTTTTLMTWETSESTLRSFSVQINGVACCSFTYGSCFPSLFHLPQADSPPPTRVLLLIVTVSALHSGYCVY